jgi:threonine synthase
MAYAHPYRCSSCGRTQPLDFPGWKCPQCGGLFNLAAPAVFDAQQIDARAQGVWRYRHTFPLPPDAAPVALGEGGTPLVATTIAGRTVHFKLESQNPTGSFKDRGMTVMFTGLRAAGVAEAIEDSSGNAGASFAGYAARAGIRGRVFVPASASGPKRAQIAAYGAVIEAVAGPRSQAAAAVRAAAEAGAYYASHIYNPLGVAGNATAAFEIWEQLGRAPDAVVLPVGHGTLLLGLQRGFQALRQAKLIDRLPRLIGVQAMACAPLWAVHTHGRDGLAWVTEGETLAEGIRVFQPLRGDAVLAAVAESGGTLLAFDDDALRAGRDALARLGLYVEATSAIVWPAVEQTAGEVVAMITGHGLKNAPAAPA